MNKAKALRKEIDEILLKPMPWGPMIVPRIKAALVQSSELISVLSSVNRELDVKVKFYEGTRADTKLSRNLEILRLYENGSSISSMCKEFGLTRQRVHKIIQMTQKYSESQYDPTRIERLPDESNIVSEGSTETRKEKDYPASPDRRW